ncbi:hypothetical protein DFH05DRAFT_1518501 [Lentinula detonsa]|uniref:Ubiquitin-like protease family profile domain-containing protein n=1 Tax=Lentinula detonsa TaxID=2804962 RepID=A0A9W8U2I6_9AGAR|nr:hypothetical protein DFH05DRAFT_1518501 [Lentinula detonsa]
MSTSYPDDGHRDCTLVDWHPFGMTRTCVAKHLLHLSTLISSSQLYVPSLSMQLLSTSENIVEVVRRCLKPLPGEYDCRFYTRTQSRIKLLCRLLDLLSHLPDIETSLSLCLNQHGVSSDSKITAIFHNAHLLQQYILKTRLDLESNFFYMLDAYPDKSAKNLKLVMKLNFETVGIGRWLDDEIINYFVTKWCSQSQTVLGLSTFFACKFLFRENACIHAKSVLTSEDKRGVQKWYRVAEKAQDLKEWDCVFILINQNWSHWYSACINFRHKCINIYDSLCDVCLDNRARPVQLRKNTNTMLVLMWFAKTLGPMRGEAVHLKDNSASAWKYDPHTEALRKCQEERAEEEDVFDEDAEFEESNSMKEKDVSSSPPFHSPLPPLTSGATPLTSTVAPETPGSLMLRLYQLPQMDLAATAVAHSYLPASYPYRGSTTITIVDSQDRIITVLGRVPQGASDASWSDTVNDLMQAIHSCKSTSTFTTKESHPQQGHFTTRVGGIGYGGGQITLGNFQISGIANQAAFSTLLIHKGMWWIVGWTHTLFNAYGHKMYMEYKVTLQEHQARNPSLQPTSPNMVFATTSVNFGPRTETHPHCDTGNLVHGWCAIITLGDYNPNEGGHLLLWDLGLIIRFPPGSTILFPSALITHSNVPIQS